MFFFPNLNLASYLDPRFSVVTLLKGTLMQILKSPYMF